MEATICSLELSLTTAISLSPLLKLASVAIMLVFFLAPAGLGKKTTQLAKYPHVLYGKPSNKVYSWVARDVTKNQTKKLSILLSFYSHEVLQFLNTFI